MGEESSSYIVAGGSQGLARCLQIREGGRRKAGELSLPVSQTVQRTQERHPGENSEPFLARLNIGERPKPSHQRLTQPNRRELSLKE